MFNHGIEHGSVLTERMHIACVANTPSTDHLVHRAWICLTRHAKWCSWFLQ